MRPAETIPGMGEGRSKENDGGGEFSYDIFDILQELLLMSQCTKQNIKKL
jgi:hypothetical protein